LLLDALPRGKNPDKNEPSRLEDIIEIGTIDCLESPQAKLEYARDALVKYAKFYIDTSGDNNGPVPVLDKFIEGGVESRLARGIDETLIRTALLEVVQRQIEGGNLSKAAFTLLKTGLAPESLEEPLKQFAIGWDRYSRPLPIRSLTGTETERLTQLWQSKLPEFLGDLLYQVDGSEDFSTRVLREIGFHENGEAINFSGKVVKGQPEPGFKCQQMTVAGIEAIHLRGLSERPDFNKMWKRSPLDEDALKIALGAFSPLHKPDVLKTEQECPPTACQGQPLYKIRFTVGSPLGPTDDLLSNKIIKLQEIALARGAQPSVVDRYFGQLLPEGSPRLGDTVRGRALALGCRACLAVIDMGESPVGFLTRLNEYRDAGVLENTEFVELALRCVDELIKSNSRMQILQKYPFLEELSGLLEEKFGTADSRAAKTLINRLTTGQYSESNFSELANFIDLGLISETEKNAALAEGLKVFAREAKWKEFDKFLANVPADQSEVLKNEALEARREILVSRTGLDYLARRSIPWTVFSPRDAQAFPDGFPSNREEAENLFARIEKGLNRHGQDVQRETARFLNGLENTTEDMRWVNLLANHPSVYLFGVDIVSEALGGKSKDTYGIEFIKDIAIQLDYIWNPENSNLHPELCTKYSKRFYNFFLGEYQGEFGNQLTRGNNDDWGTLSRSEMKKIADEIGQDRAQIVRNLNEDQRLSLYVQASTRVEIIAAIEDAADKVVRKKNIQPRQIRDPRRSLLKSAFEAHNRFIITGKNANQDRFNLPPLPKNMPSAGDLKWSLIKAMNSFPDSQSLPASHLKNFSLETPDQAIAVLQFANEPGLTEWQIDSNDSTKIVFNGEDFLNGLRELGQKLGLRVFSSEAYGSLG